MTNFSSYGCLVDLVVCNSKWVPAGGAQLIARMLPKMLLINGNGLTWTRDAAGLVTVNWTAHNLPVEAIGGIVHLTQGTVSSGTNVTTGWGFTNFNIIDANTFSVQTSVLSSGAGTFASNVNETFTPDYVVVPDGLFYPYSLGSVVNFRAKPSAVAKTIKSYVGTLMQISASITNAAGATAYVTQQGTRVLMLSDTQLMLPAAVAGNTGFVTTYSTRNPCGSMQVPVGEWCLCWPELCQITGL